MKNGPQEIPNPPAAAADVDHDELVDVLDTKEESEALVVRGLLESAGIEALVSYLEAPQDVLPGVGGIVVRVRPEQAAEAENLINDYRANGPAAADAEEAASEGPQP